MYVKIILLMFCIGFIKAANVRNTKKTAKIEDPFQYYNIEENEIPVDEELMPKVQADYLKPTRCQDLETGTFYKVGAEWYSTDPELCVKMSCEIKHFPEIKVTTCADYFKNADPKTACNFRKRLSFPYCCDQCWRG